VEGKMHDQTEYGKEQTVAVISEQEAVQEQDYD
jgi:hypothetical protein